MWLLPAGYNYVMQAASGGNDTFPATYLLAALFFAGKAKQENRASYLYWSLLAAALLSGVKTSNVLLLLPCMIAVWPALRTIFSSAPRLSKTALVAVVCILCSFIPLTFLNHRFTGEWTGSPGDPVHFRLHSTFAGLLANSHQMIFQNLWPPILPFPDPVNHLIGQMIPQRMLDFLKRSDMLRRDYPQFAYGYGELPTEESVGLGLGLSLALAISLVVILLRWGREHPYKASAPRTHAVSRLAIVWGYLALLTLMLTLAHAAMARLASPYYPLLISAFLIHPANAWLVSQRWWQFAAAAIAASALPGVILTPSRPLWPARTVLRWIARQHPNSASLHRANTVFEVYSHRADCQAPVRAMLPSDCKIVGLISGEDDTELSLWLPWGSRRVVHILDKDDLEQLPRRGVRYIVAVSKIVQPRTKATNSGRRSAINVSGTAHLMVSQSAESSRQAHPC